MTEFEGEDDRYDGDYGGFDDCGVTVIMATETTALMTA